VKIILEWDIVNWIHLAQRRDQWRALVNGSRKRRGTFRTVERLPAPQEGLSCVGLWLLRLHMPTLRSVFAESI
jgi:hypothetical protein